MFCSYCGNKVHDDALFCSNCGKKIAPLAELEEVQNQSAPVLAAQEDDLCNTEAQKLFKAIEYFKEKSTQYATYDNACNQINYYARGTKSALLVWGFIALSFAVLFALMTILEQDYEALIAFLIVFVLPSAAMLIGGILMKVRNRKNLAFYKNEYARLSQELYAYYLNFSDCPVGAEYTNPQVLSRIAYVLQTTKASTVIDSINILTCGTNQTRIADYLNKIRQNTADINMATGVSTFFAPAEFFR